MSNVNRPKLRIPAVSLSLVTQPLSHLCDLVSLILPMWTERCGLPSWSLITRHSSLMLLLLSLTLSPALAEQEQNSESVSPQKPVQVTLEPHSSYVLRPRDQILIQAVEAEEINNKTVRIDGDGNLNFPMVGRIRAAGLTIAQFEAELSARLKAYVREPDIVINVTEFASQPVTVMGAVTTPGVHQLLGPKTLFELLSMAGGVRADAGYRVKITRRKEWGPIPLPSATEDPSGQFTIAEVNLKSIFDAKNPEENISIQPYDVITVPRAEVVYVMGEVQNPRGLILDDRETITALQALVMAGGLGKGTGAQGALSSSPAPQAARILRIGPGATRVEIPVNLKAILSGKKADVNLQPDDILFIPNNAALSAIKLAVQSVISSTITAALYRTISGY
jgi:polysaccharide biosynthesis/export protein